MITDKVADGLKLSVPRTLRFYITPKIHKSGNQGCLAIRSFNCHTVIISKYIDNHLQSVVKQIPSYIKDTNDFINIINGVRNIPPNSYLVTMDVKSLNSNTPTSEGIAAVKNAYNSYPKISIANKVITSFPVVILTLNNFIFNCKHDVNQIMRDCQHYANILMASFESEYLPIYKRKN